MQTITMKRQTFIIISLGVITALLTSCDPRETMFETFGEEQGLQTYTLYLDADVPSFESGHEGETRASDSSWEDGDVIYVSFSNGGSTKVCNATYKSTLGAFQFSTISLNAINDASCSVYYFRGGDVSFSNNTVTMDKYTAIFTDTNAKYTCTNNTITLSASLKPYTWRLCFRGGRGTDIKINSTSNILYNTSLNLSNGDFTTTTDNINLQVQSDGYTPYIYGRFSITGNQINVEVGSSSFSRSIESSKLDIGKSGYFSIPTSSDLNGWRMITAYNGHEYVDLGLPSGTLWATCNIGASVPEEYGGYYAWGEIEEKEYYFLNTMSNHYIGDDIAGSDYDVAHVMWGGSWCMPSNNQIKELIDNCSSNFTTINGIDGIKVTGPNGSSLFLPAAGYRLNEQYYSSCGAYRTSAYGLEGEEGGDLIFDVWGDWGWQQFYRGDYYGCSVRAVCNLSRYPLYLSQYGIDLKVGQSSTIKVTCGSGNYLVSNEDPEVAKGTILNSEILIEALQFGSATIIVEDLDLNLKAKIIVKVTHKTDPSCIAESVDLGLPSGTKWASWNIGATAPEEFGSYYAWGEIEEKDYYSHDTYNFGYKHIGDNIAGSEYDVAHIKWGGTWQMPSYEQFHELYNNCTTVWITKNGINGRQFTGPNGASIFLPAAGSISFIREYNQNSSGLYWTSSIKPVSDGYAEAYAHHCIFDDSFITIGYYGRSYGLTVRAVCH